MTVDIGVMFLVVMVVLSAALVAMCVYVDLKLTRKAEAALKAAEGVKDVT